jgi:uncharacterized membrane protein
MFSHRDSELESVSQLEIELAVLEMEAIEQQLAIISLYKERVKKIIQNEDIVIINPDGKQLHLATKL